MNKKEKNSVGEEILVVNPVFQNWCPQGEEQNSNSPVKNHSTYPPLQNSDGGAFKNQRVARQGNGSNCSYYKKGCQPNLVILFTGLLLMSTASLTLSVLMLFGKVGETCGCTPEKKQEGSFQESSAQGIDGILDKVNQLENNLTQTHNFLINTDIDSLKMTVAHSVSELRGRDDELNTILMMINDSLSEKLMLTSAQLESTDEELRRTLKTVNTSLHAQIDGDVGALRSDINLTRSQLQAADTDLQDAIASVNTSLIATIQDVGDSLDILYTWTNQTKEDLTLFKNSTDHAFRLTEARIDNLQSECNSTKIELQDADADLFVALSDVNITLTLKLENVSKMVGPVGPRGFNGSQGPIGPQGPSGFNGSQGIQGPTGPPGVNGSQGPQGFNGSQGVQGATGPEGPQGAGKFSQCQYLTDSSSATSGVFADISIGVNEDSDKKILGVTCSTNDASLTELSSTVFLTRPRYICSCKGTTNLLSPGSSMICTIHYWQCPLIT